MWDEQAKKPYRNQLVGDQLKRKYFPMEEWEYQQQMRRAQLEERQGKAEYEKRRGSGKLSLPELTNTLNKLMEAMAKMREMRDADTGDILK